MGLVTWRHIYLCNNKSILVSTLLFFCINVCMESNKNQSLVIIFKTDEQQMVVIF
jgi:hypothetical protein